MTCPLPARTCVPTPRQVPITSDAQRRGTAPGNLIRERAHRFACSRIEVRTRPPIGRQTVPVDVTLAEPDDVGDLARLVWLLAAPDEQARQSVASFAIELAAWCRAHRDTHLAFLARTAAMDAVGMAWLALVPRVPRPGNTERLTAEVQSVFVLPEHRGSGTGAALVRAASEHAERLGASRVTVHAGAMAVPLYERLGFAASPQLLQRPPE